MPMTTFFSHEQQELKDKELEKILAEANSVCSEKWLVEEREYKPLFRKFLYFYTLNFSLGGGEYQVINFYNGKSDSSINSSVSAEMVAAYLYGYMGGFECKK